MVSNGCTNCYAMKQAHRFHGKGQPYEGLTKLSNGGPVWTGKIKLVPELLERPLHWKYPRRVFVNSMSDLFHEDVPDEFIASVFAVMRDVCSHTFQILTKRPSRACELLNDPEFYECVDEKSYIHETETMFSAYKRMEQFIPPGPPYPNVWLGVSVEDQKTADERIPLLLQTPAAVRWISAEPLLGAIDLTWLDAGNRFIHAFGNSTKLDWVVAGGESGPGARPSHPDWFRSLRDQCVAADVPFFFKQWGEWYGGVTNVNDKGPLRICRGGIVEHHDYNEPPDSFFMVGAESTVQRVGKKKAGRTIDGETWDQYPE